MVKYDSAPPHEVWIVAQASMMSCAFCAYATLPVKNHMRARLNTACMSLPYLPRFTFGVRLTMANGPCMA
jgi:hypothetical protein